MVARYLGVVEAAGSNPVTQTNKNQSSERVADFLFIFMQNLNQRSLLVIPERLPRKRRASGDIGHLAMRRKAPSWLLVQIQSLIPIKKEHRKMFLFLLVFAVSFRNRPLRRSYPLRSTRRRNPQMVSPSHILFLCACHRSYQQPDRWLIFLFYLTI